MASSEVLLRLRLAGQQQVKQGLEQTASAVDRLGNEARETAAQTRQAGDASTRMGDGAGKSSGNVRKLAKAAVALGAGFAAIHQAKDAINTTVDLGKATLGLGNSFGLDTQVAANWAVVAKVRGIETSKLSMGITTLSKNVARNADEFKALGVSQEVLKRGNVQEILEQTSDGLAKMPAGAQKAAIMAKLFGRSWQSLRPILAGGSGAMKEQLALAQKYVPDLASSKDGVADLAKAQREAKFATMGLQVTFGKLLVPALTKVSETTAKVVGFFRENKTAAEALKIAAIALAAAFAVNKILSWGAAIKSSTLATKSMTIAQAALNLVMRMNPVMLVVTAIAALAAGLAIVFRKTDLFKKILNAAWSALKTGFNWVKANWPTLLAILTGPIGLAVLAIVKNFDRIKSAAKRVWSGIKGIFSKGAEIIGNVFKAPINGFIRILRGIKIEVKAKKVLGETIIPGFRLAPFEGLNTLDTGGRVLGGGAVVVGGTGPEILHVRQGDRVTNPRKAATVRRDADPFATGRRSGDAPRVVTLDLQWNKRQLARALVDAGELEAALG